jgi:hypothetical protein
MDIAKAFTYITEDERWVGKIGIGALISLLSFLLVPIPLLVGYVVGISRNVMEQADRPLPEWDDFGRLFRDGLSILVAQFVYTLPFWLLTCIAIIATVGFSGLTGVSEDAAALGIISTFGLVSCLGLLFALALFFISPAIVIQYLRTDNLGACFRFGEVIGIARDNVGDILIAALASFVASFIIGSVLGILNIIPCLGQILSLILGVAAGPYLAAITGHLYGQIAAKVSGKAAGFA